MRMTAWAVLGSLLISLMLGLLDASVFSVAPARAAEPHACAETHPAVHARESPAQRPPAERSRHGYLVDVRMGWAIG